MNGPALPPAISAVYRADLGTFVVKVFETVSPGDRYQHNWHIDAIVHELLQVVEGKNQRLIINQPPRSLKSICVSVALVAWWIGHDPSMKFGCISYSSELAATFHRMFRAVLKSDWYRAAFPGVKIEKDTEALLTTTKGGSRFSTSVGGTVTGLGFDVIIIDDPMKADEAHSEIARKKVIDYYRETLISRLDDPQKGAFIVVMQRLHEDDLTGYLLAGGNWRHLDLPAIAQEDRSVAIGPSAVQEFRRGELLFPSRMPQNVLDAMREETGTLGFSAQYLQRPVPIDGNLVRREWFRYYKTLPDGQGHRIVQSWDVASTTNDSSDYSVCTTWMMVKQDYYLVDVWRGRLEFPRLRQKYIQLDKQFRPHVTLIEKDGPGLHLFQEFFLNPPKGMIKPLAEKSEGNKIMRMEAQSARIEAGQVHLPADAPWLGDFLHELLGFPHARHDDQVDSVSQFLGWAARGGHGRKKPVVSFSPVIVMR